MQIARLNIERVRNLQAVAITDLQPFNVFCGQNGSGKTSILESIHLLATGRSFRTHIPKLYIQHQAKDAIIFAQSDDDDRIGVQKYSTGEQVIRVNGDNVATQGQLAKLLPVQHIDPQSTDIIDYGAKARRQLLDWLMFHIEPAFYEAWRQYNRALKQRNRLLKEQRHLTIEQLDVWNKLLVQYGERLHYQRVQIVEEWQLYLQEELVALLPHLKIHMEYSAGFHHEMGLAYDLLYYHQKDLDRRNTEYGPHRADLKFKSQLGAADETLSRGQKKMLIIALKLSQIAMLHSRNIETVVLLDDLTSELDSFAQQRLLQRLSQLGSQVFITALEQTALVDFLQTIDIKYRLFQVENGQVHAQSSPYQ